jgi:hypothetical protein
MDEGIARALAGYASLTAQLASRQLQPPPSVALIFSLEEPPRVEYRVHDQAAQERLFDFLAQHTDWADLVLMAHDLIEGDETP